MTKEKSDHARQNRLSKLQRIPFFAQLDHRHSLDSEGNLNFLKGLNRKERRKLKYQTDKLVRGYRSLMQEQRNSGAKLPADLALREFTVEYNHRFASAGVYSQPVSFNYIEPFCKVELIEEAAPCVKIVEEVDHLINFRDFFEYITGSYGHIKIENDYSSIREGVAFHFSYNGKINELTFLAETGHEFVIASFSFIRWGNSICWYLVGGEQFRTDEWATLCGEQNKIDVDRLSPYKRKFLSEMIEINGPDVGAPRELDGTTAVQRIVLAGEFDIESNLHLSRCRMSETENLFEVATDDPEVLLDVAEAEREKVFENMMERIEASAVLWDLVDALIALPSYLQKSIHIESSLAARSRVAIKTLKGGKGLHGNYIIIPSLSIEQNQNCDNPIKKLLLPHYEVDASGHWRRIERNQIGKDRYGKPVKGKTWVKRGMKQRARPISDHSIYLKDTLASAKVKADQIIASASEANTLKVPENGSISTGEVVYVLRCPTMANEVYKIGFTSNSAEERAKQLSAETGVPEAFTVAGFWQHEKASKIEKEAHMMLAPYRINDGREFFQVDYETIRTTLAGIIARA